MRSPVLELTDGELLQALEEAIQESSPEATLGEKATLLVPYPSREEAGEANEAQETPADPARDNPCNSDARSLSPPAAISPSEEAIPEVPKPTSSTVSATVTSTTRRPVLNWKASEKPEVPIHLPVDRYELGWRCGYPGHDRYNCTGVPRIFCSQCGLYGVMTRDCKCRRRRRGTPAPSG